MNQHTNEPKPFLLEIHGLKPLSFDVESDVEALGMQSGPSGLKTQPDEIGPLPPIRRLGEQEEIDVWDHAAVDSSEDRGGIFQAEPFDRFDDTEIDVIDDLI